jgi:hypothetical protein
MNKINIYIIILVLLSISVFASRPDYSVVIDIPAELEQGINDANILIKKNNPIPDEYNITQCQDINIQQYDIIRWRGTEQETLEINNELLTLNNFKQFSTIGTYYFNCSQNQYSLNINRMDDYNINIINNNINGIAINYDKNNFILNSDTLINLDINVSNSLISNNYNLVFNISDNITQKIINRNIIVAIKENKQFIVINDNINESIAINTAESQLLGDIQFKNIGNIDYIMNITVNGNISRLLIHQQPQIIYKDSFVYYNFNIVVPSTTPKGIYSGTIIFGNDVFSYNKTLNITVKDNISPVIETLDIDTNILYIPNKISSIIKDNIEVASATISFLNNSYIMKKDNQLFFYETNFTDLREHDFKICASDFDNNVVCKELNFTFIKLDAFNLSTPLVNMPKVKTNTFSKTMIINNSFNIKNQKICLKNFVDENNININSYDIRLMDKHQNYVFFSESNNCSNLYDGENYLQIRLNNYSRYSFELHFNVSEFIETISYLRVSGAFLEYDISPTFSLEWNGVPNGYICEPIDTGEYDTSYMKCVAQYPIDIRAGDISIPTTVRERQRFDTEVQEQNDIYMKEKKTLSFIIVFFIILSLFLGIGIYFISEIYPYLFLINDKMQEKEEIENE